MRRVQDLAFDSRKRGDSSRIHHDRRLGGFTTICIPTWTKVPYVVTDEAIQHGYAHLDDCRPAAKIT
jgi:hypothetical protein